MTGFFFIPQVTRRGSLVLLATLVMLAGCEGRATFDLHSSAPADPTILDVSVDLEGIELTGDRTHALTYRDPERIDLVDYVGGQRLFTDEDLGDGRYTGIRLLFSLDDDDRNEDVVVRADGEFPLTVAEGPVADVDFTVDKDDSSRDHIVITIDLRQSLSYDEDEREYTLTPLVRAARGEDTGRLIGLVRASCPSGRTLAQGGAVYVFTGSDQTPDDRGSGVEPYLTTGVGADGGTGAPAYSFEYLPDGEYTVALTCDGHLDDPATNDDVRFQNVANVRVRAEETTTRDLGS
jgi:hypothetical protein